MKAQCLPFSEIPHTSRLFADFISDFSKVKQFYPRSPYFAEWVKDRRTRQGYDPSRRERVCTILERQNKNWGASPATLQNISRLRSGASVVVTGQQVGLFGGPLFAVFKALTAVKLADQATAAGVDCVPVFWLATTDHDLAEINHVSLPGQDGSLHELATPTQGVFDAPVGMVTFGPEITAVVEAAAATLGDTDVTRFLRESYRPGETFGSSFALLFTRLVAERGVIMLDAADPELHRIAEPIYRTALEGAAELDEALLARGKALEDAGYHQQVKVTPSSTLLFTLRDGARVPIHRRSNGSTDEDFLVGGDTVSRADLLRNISSAPQDFSANVLLRPVLQDYLLPTLAYTGGAAEVAYFAQAAVVYQAILKDVTPIVPRFSATLVEAKPQQLLDRYRLTLTTLFQGPERVRESLAAQTLPQELQAAFVEADAVLKKSLAAIVEPLARLDKTLVEAATNAGSKMQHQLEQLRSRAARAELRQGEVLSRHAELLSNALYPNKTLQERETAGLYFVARHGGDFLHQLYDAIQTDCLDHQVISL